MENVLTSTINFAFILSQFQQHISVHYQLLCSLLTLELKYEVRSLLRRIFMRIGQEFNIIRTVETQEKVEDASTEAR